MTLYIDAVSAMTAEQRKKTVVLYRVSDNFQKDGVLTATFVYAYFDEQEGTTGNICNRITAKGFNVAIVGDNDNDIIDYYPACKLENGYSLSDDGANVIYSHDTKFGRELTHFPFSQYRRGVRVVEDGSKGPAEQIRNKYAFIVLGRNGGKAYYRYMVRGYCMTPTGGYRLCPRPRTRRTSESPPALGSDLRLGIVSWA